MTHKIVAYGGAFTPPTIGHKAIVDGLVDHGISEQVLLIPSGVRSDKQYAYTDDIRKRFLRTFIGDITDGIAELDMTWIDSGEETTTLGMDTFLYEKYGYSIPQVFGADITREMKNWVPEGDDRERLLRVIPKIFIYRTGIEMVLDGLENYEIHDFDIPNASSTAVRERKQLDLLTTGVRREFEQALQTGQIS